MEKIDNKEEKKEKAMTFIGHLEELRKRIIVVLVALAVAFGAFYPFKSKILVIFTKPLVNKQLVFLDITEPFLVNVKIVFMAAVIVIMPLLVFQILAFLFPAFNERLKKRVVLIGILFSVSIQPLWASTFLLPPLFVVSAVSTGAAILILAGLITRTWKIHGETIRRMIQVDAIVIVVELVILLVYLLWLSKSGIPGASEAMITLTTGVLAVRLWLGVVLLAMMVPFALDVAHWGKKLEEHRTVLIAAVVSSACVIFGGLILRIVIIIGGQI